MGNPACLVCLGEKVDFFADQEEKIAWYELKSGMLS